MPELKTDQSLLSALERASTLSPSRDQMERQRISFVMGSLPNRRNITREQVRDALERRGGTRTQG